MIVVRSVLQAQFGKGGELAALVGQAMQQMTQEMGTGSKWRVLTDLSGPFDTVVLEVEAESLIPPLASVIPMVLGRLRAEFTRRLDKERCRQGVDVDEAADLLARMMLSHMGSPGSWDLDDPAEVSRLVRHWLLAGVLVDP